jgi:YidC/Oxa1 family membrane protein insertase
MQTILDILNKPLGWILEGLSALCGGNFAGAIFVFTVLMNLAMIPLSIKSQKSMVQQARLKPKLDEIKRKYGDDRMRYSQETQKLYTQEGVSMSGGCLPMLIRLPIMMSIYYLIRSPLTYLIHIPKDVIQSTWDQITAANLTTAKYLDELTIIKAVNSGQIANSAIEEGAKSINFSFLGLDLTQTPHFSMNIFHDAQWIWIIPLLSFAAAMVSSIITMVIQKKANPDAPNRGFMLLTMPIFSLVIAFTVPGGVGFYWACSSLVSGLIQAAVQIQFGPQQLLAKERAKETFKRYEEEQAKIAKRSARETAVEQAE